MTTLSDSIKARLEADTQLMTILTGGVHNDVEEISRQNTPSAFDGTTKEIKPCALIKLANETPAGPFVDSVRTTVVIYFYQRQGYGAIEPAMGFVFSDLNEQRIGEIWTLEYVGAVYQQRDQSLDCALGSLRFSAVRRI